jgi:hypothetical protein
MRKNVIVNERYPHQIKIIRRSVPDRYQEGGEQEEVIYEGKGRSYTDTTTTGNAKVDLNKRKASIPVRFDEWKDKIPQSGDILIVVKANITEQWEVKDFEPDNNRTVIYGEYNRNANESEVSDGQ